METWQTVGIVDIGAVSMPHLVRRRVKFRAHSWQNAFQLAPGYLRRQGNSISPITIERLERLEPKPTVIDD